MFFSPKSIITHIYTGGSGSDRIYVETAVADAVRVWEQKSCVTFPQRTTETNYILVRQASGCSSFIGDVFGDGVQNLNLAFASQSNPQCVNVSGIIMQ